MTDRAALFRERAREHHGIEVEPEEFPEGTRTAADAADALGCDADQIASAIVLVADDVLVAIISGADEVDTREIATLRGVHEARLANPEEVEETIGWPVGAVPPFCHDTDVPVYVEDGVTNHETVWASAGSRTSVFPIDPQTIVDAAGATIASFATEG